MHYAYMCRESAVGAQGYPFRSILIEFFSNNLTLLLLYFSLTKNLHHLALRLRWWHPKALTICPRISCFSFYIKQNNALVCRFQCIAHL
jgi:hypothetical protein